MKNLDKSVIWCVAGISVLTIAVGTYAWMALECTPGSDDPCALPFEQALYAAVLAIGGSDIYHAQTDFWIKTTRWLGAATGLAFLLGLLAILSASWLRRWWIKTRSGHLVLVGVNDFSLSYALARRAEKQHLVLVDTEANLEAVASGRYGGRVLRAPVDFIDDDALDRAMGQEPDQVIFADPSASLNVERAQSVAAKGRDLKIRIRSEKQNITADLDLWSPSFADVPVFSQIEFAARALVTELEPMNIARLRGQTRPHIAVIGVGDMALGLIEELGLRCHAHDLGKLKISTFDKDADAAWLKLEMERGGLSRAICLPRTQALDGRNCGSVKPADDPLCKLEAAQDPLTAIIICTGDDEVNVDIALRLRRLQDAQGLCMAPILMRSRTASSVAPDPINDLSSGLFRFGGPQVRDTDIAYEKMQARLGRKMHEKWGEEAQQGGAKAWNKLDLGERRTNTRAAVSAVELYQSLQLVPPAGAAAADLRLHPDLIDEVLDLEAEMPDLAETEHQRWVAERSAEGWKQTEADPPTKEDRDTRRKIHWLLMDFDRLKKVAPQEVKKDSNNVRAVFAEARRQHEIHPQSPTWHKRLRVGVMGPIHMEPDTDFSSLVRQFQGWMLQAGMSPLTHQLELVTPNAPGFDRMAASVLLKAWRQQAGRPADLLRLEADTLRYLDLRVEEKVEQEEERANLARAHRAQSAELAKHALGRNRRMTLRGGPIAQGDFEAEVIAAADAMSALCDVTIYHARPGGGDFTRANADARKQQDKPILWFQPGDLTYGEP